MSLEQAIQTQSFPTPGVPVLLGSNLDEGSTFMCVSEHCMPLLTMPAPIPQNSIMHTQRETHTGAHLIQSLQLSHSESRSNKHPNAHAHAHTRQVRLSSSSNQCHRR